MRARAHALVGNGGIKRRQVDRPHRLGAEHERIIVHAVTIDAHLLRQRAQAVEALLRLRRDAAVEQMRGGEVARFLQRLAERENAAPAAFVVLRRPFLAVAADRGERDRLVADQGVGLQAVFQRRQIAQRLDRRAGLALRLGDAVELAQRIGEAAAHRQDAAGGIFDHHRRALHLGTHPQLGLAARFHCVALPCGR